MMPNTDMGAPHQNERLFSLLEYASEWLVRIPYIPYAAWLFLRYRGITLPAIANPSFFMGDLVGASKTDMHACMGARAREHFAPFITIHASAAMPDIRAQLTRAKLAFPLVAKPDLGRNGRGVKMVADEAALAAHLAKFPRDVRMIIQRYVPARREAGVFYVRRPSEHAGRITSLTLKSFPYVVGDDRSTLRELILADERASKIAHIYFRRNKRALDEVIPEGVEYPLVSVGNHVRGAIFTNGAAAITPELTAVFDRISKDIDGFYFGRYDVRYDDFDAFKRGAGFTIIEFNGASSEPTHVWDRRTSVRDTYRTLLGHWRMAFEIGAENRARGTRAPSIRAVLRAYAAEDHLIGRYPDEE